MPYHAKACSVDSGYIVIQCSPAMEADAKAVAMTYLDHQSAEMTRNYTQIYDETLKRKFKEMILSGRAVGGIALHALREQITSGDERELDWVVANLRKLSLPWGQCLHHAKAPKCPYGAEYVLYQRQRSLPQTGHHAGARSGDCGDARGPEKKPAGGRRTRLGTVRQRPR